jgi:purine-binding chemotaxis protein CheW
MSEPSTMAQAKALPTHPFQVVVFRLGEEEYGLHIDQIKEVVITPTITRMPQTPSYIKGVANVRGNVIAILDLEEKFKLNTKKTFDSSKNNFTLVIESEEYKMGVMVKEVPNTFSLTAGHIDQAVFVGGEHRPERSCITGIAKIDTRLIIMIDIFKVISEQELENFFTKETVAHEL